MIINSIKLPLVSLGIWLQLILGMGESVQYDIIIDQQIDYVYTCIFITELQYYLHTVKIPSYLWGASLHV